MKTRIVIPLLISGLTVVGLACWLAMFLDGTDVWHAQGSPDFWNLSGPPYTDMRAFAYAFYAQFVVLLAVLAFTGWTILSAARRAG